MADIPHSMVDWVVPIYVVGFLFLVVSTLHVGIPLDVALLPASGFLGIGGWDAAIYISIIAAVLIPNWKTVGFPIWAGLIALFIVLVGVV